MAVQTDPVPPNTSTDGTVVLPRRRHAFRGWFLLAFGAWNVWVWVTRALNLVEERGDWSAAFVAVHSVLFGAGIIGGVVLGVIGVRMLRETRRPKPAR